MTPQVQLEPEAQTFANRMADSLLFNLDAEKGRTALDNLQSGSIDKPSVEIDDLTVRALKGCEVSIRVLRPENVKDKLPVIVFIHGGGWVFGGAITHDRLNRDLAVGAHAAVVFPNFSRSPGAKFPTAMEECYAVVKWIADHGNEFGLDAHRIAIAGDGAGGNMAAAITLMAKERGGPAIHSQLLFYPVTNAAFDSASYQQFAEGYYLSREAMRWFWDQYTTNESERSQIIASPLRASGEQLKGLPPALIITAEADVVRDEGEAYANQLRAAGVRVTAVRFQGTIHDFVMLNDLAESSATRGAIALANSWLREGFSKAF